MSSTISALTAMVGSPAANDLIPIVDVDDTVTPPAGPGGSDKRVTVAALLAAAATVLQPSNDTSGVTDAANISAAVTALPASGGTVKLAATGTWYLACGSLTINRSGAYIDGAGCYIKAVGAGDVIRMLDSSSYASRGAGGGGGTAYGGGVLGYPVIDGSATTGNSAGLHAGDIFNLAVFVQAVNFTAGTTSKGVWLDNTVYFTEQAYGRIYAQNCTAHVVFDGSTTTATAAGSFDRANLDIRINQFNAAQDGVVFQGGTYITDGPGIWISGNFQTSSTVPSSAVLRITGQSAAGRSDAGTYSSLQMCGLTIGAECGIVTGTLGAHTIVFGSSSNSIWNCTGAMDFGADGLNFQAASGLSGNFVYWGPINGDNSLAASVTAYMTTQQITMYGSSGSAGPAKFAGDGNNMATIATPAGLTGILQQSQYGATASIGNVTTETALVSMTVPANDPVAGATYRISGFATAVISTTAPTITFRLRWGGTSGTVLAVTTAIATTISKSNVLEFDAVVIFTSTTQAVAKITVNLAGSTTAESPGNAGTATQTLAVSTTATTVTVSSSEALVLTAAFSAADSQSLTSYGHPERVS